jgi:hypothetical protein
MKQNITTNIESLPQAPTHEAKYTQPTAKTQYKSQIQSATHEAKFCVAD